MDERRKNKRTGMVSTLVIKRLDDNSNEEVAVSIVDVSKSGIGFECADQLQIGEVYEAFLTIWTKEVIHALLQIVRITKKPGGYIYGAVFMGMSETDAARIETYQIIQDYE